MTIASYFQCFGLCFSSSRLTGLPMLGYLEQGAASAVIRALTAVGCFKPKFPFASVQKSSLFYIACHLKGNRNNHQ